MNIIKKDNFLSNREITFSIVFLISLPIFIYSIIIDNYIIGAIFGTLFFFSLWQMGKNQQKSIRQTRESITLGRIECKDFYPLSPTKYFYFSLCLISLLLTIYLWGDEWMRVVFFGVLLFSLWELRRLFKYPVMRITDELLILDHDNLSIDWQDVKSIMLGKEKRKLRIEVEFI